MGRVVPRWVWPALLIALLAMSSAAPVLRTMAAVPPLLRASWRQQLTTVFVLPPAAVEFRSLSPELRARLREPAVLLRIVGSGLLIGAHFGLWIWALDHTTIMHAMLLVSSNPILLAIGRTVCALPIDGGEIFGAFLGFGGVGLSVAGELTQGGNAPTTLAADAQSAEQVQLVGDLAALAASGAFVLYLLIGRELRQWLPNFLYVFPVFGISALALTAAAAIEGATLGGENVRFANRTFGYLSGAWILPVAYLAAGPGVCGHASVSMCVAHLDPLVISVVMLGEPALSSLIGSAMGVSGVPGMWTLAGGLMLLVGCAVTIFAARRRELRGGGGASR
ncbi:hypothetical protein T492DRAFT_542296 [Pavlovales sp. CCMP2436]|nr:hypothetical protein T492DRAFT_542296 [Pavlovales sp. CCMP2436]